MALQRQDFLRVLQLNEATDMSACSACLYAFYRLGCYRRVLELAKGGNPKCAQDVVAISVSLAVTGAFQQCEDMVLDNLMMLQRKAEYAVEAARGIVRFIPSLAVKLCQDISGTSDLTTAAQLVAGQDGLARREFVERRAVSRRELAAGHYFLKANLAASLDEKLANLNRQLAEFGLSSIEIDARQPIFALEKFRNVSGVTSGNGPLVSVIVPAFEAATHLEMSVRSILQQSYYNIEVIIVDDGSSDDTLLVAQNLVAGDPRVRVLHFAQNQGAYAARNAALKEAKGQFVTVHDADDFAHRQKIERQVKPLLRNENLVFSVSDLVRVAADGTFARREVYPLQRMNTSSLLFRRELVLRDCGDWEEKRYGADSEYLFRLRNRYPKDRWVRLRQPLTFAAERSESLTGLISTGGLGHPSDPRRIAYIEEYTQRLLRQGNMFLMAQVPPVMPNWARLWRTRLLSAPTWCHQLLRTATAPKSTRYACTSLMLARSQAVATVVGDRPVFYSRFLALKGGVVLGWGRKWSGLRASAIAARYGREVRLLEDGFLRSVGRHDRVLSVVLDRSGIHYDGTMPSDMERLAGEDLTETEIARSRSLMAMWRSERLSKYNSARDGQETLPPRYVLVCDQTFGDASIKFGGATGASFGKMLSAALAEYPEHAILLKTHPDVINSGKKGYFNLADVASNKRVRIVSDPIHPARLIEHADVVYTVTSQLGFEALLWGKPVRCFGMPFYAGWGLTDDFLPPPERRRPISLEQLVHAALVKYPHYIDPLSLKLCQPERAFAHVGLQRRRRSAFPPAIAAVGFSRWKRPFVAHFLQGSRVVFAKSLPSGRPAHNAQAIAIWGSADVPAPWAEIPVLRVEDGFLRSSGLGADLVRPSSLVIDDIGIYFDASRPSRLEIMLETQTLDASEMRRARLLRKRIVELDLTKYNLGRRSWMRPDTDKTVFLVVGQVETDASIRLGSPEVRTNVELLRRVRQEAPEAYIVYKPHPDVIAGLRRKGRDEDLAWELADEILITPVAAGQLLAQVDVVHTMTSLMGFEALMRGRKVVTHGMPFYAGWGLTEDRLHCDRRCRKLSLDELVYGALIRYPRYFNYDANCFVEPEEAVEQLAALAERGPKTRNWSRKLLRVAIQTWIKLTGNRR